MKITTRIYMDAALQNVKSVAFFTFLPVLIARLGASNFQISLSNSLPPLFCALSLAFLTRQFPVTRQVFLTGGYVRQFAFLCMALCALIPHSIPLLLMFWSINAVSVMMTSAQQPAILRKWVEPAQFPKIFSTNKIIGIVIVTIGSFTIGSFLDATDAFFPKNYVFAMLIGCLSTFTGMSLIAGLAPRERKPFRLHWVTPFRECDRTICWMGLNNVGIAMVGPLFTIYHVKMLQLNNTQIAYFVITSGIVSALVLPVARKWMERFGVTKIYSAAVLGMAVCILPYGFVKPLWLLIIMQGFIGVCLSVHEVSTNSVMMEEAGKHSREMDYFSDFQLVINLGNAVGALLTGLLIAVFPVWACFVLIFALRLAFFCSIRLKLPSRRLAKNAAV